jgi:hypothetical protein
MVLHLFALLLKDVAQVDLGRAQAECIGFDAADVEEALKLVGQQPPGAMNPFQWLPQLFRNPAAAAQARGGT